VSGPPMSRRPLDTATSRSVLICASGRSLLEVAPERLISARCRIVAVNGAIARIGDAADDWFTLDPSPENRQRMRERLPWVRYWAAVPEGYGSARARCPNHRAPCEAGVTFLRRLNGGDELTPRHGLADNPAEIAGGNSAYGALGLAYHWLRLCGGKAGFLGLDGGDRARFDGTRCRGALDHLPALFRSAVPQLDAAGIVVKVGNPRSAVGCFTRVTAERLLTWLEDT